MRLKKLSCHLNNTNKNECKPMGPFWSLHASSWACVNCWPTEPSGRALALRDPVLPRCFLTACGTCDCVGSPPWLWALADCLPCRGHPHRDSLHCCAHTPVTHKRCWKRQDISSLIVHRIRLELWHPAWMHDEGHPSSWVSEETHTQSLRQKGPQYF